MAERQRMGMTPAFGPGLYVSLRQYEANFSHGHLHVALPAARRFYGPELAPAIGIDRLLPGSDRPAEGPVLAVGRGERCPEP